MVKQLSTVEWWCWKSTQHPLWECVENVGIPSSVVHDKLESTVCRIHHIDINISGEKIETYQLLGKNTERTIAKFYSRKDCEHTMYVKKDLKDFDASDPDLPLGAKLYVNDRLYP